MYKSLYTSTAPSVEPVTLEEAKLFCRVDTSDDDTLISSLIKSAREASEKRTGRVYITQSIKMVAEIDSTFIVLPKPPFISLTTLKYLDGDEAWQSMTVATDYLTSTRGQMGTITLKTVPFVNNEGQIVIEAVYQAGYGASGSYVPEALKQAILHRVAAMYEHRGGDALDFSAAHKLEAPYRLVLP